MERTFRNRYFGMRHGFSRANEMGIISSGIRDEEFGLVSSGLEAVAQRAIRHANEYGAINLICSSPSLRARETSYEAAPWLKTDNIEIFMGLRERDFGDLNLSPDGDYLRVWEWDLEHPDRDYHGTENARSVAARMMEVLDALERRFQSLDILLVSHGDPLDILEAVLHGLDPGDHRKRPYALAEIRRLA